MRFALYIFLFVALFSTFPALLLGEGKRPKIEDIAAAPIKNQEAPEGWIQTKQSLLYLIAEMQALYPNAHSFYIARDGEYAYDMAQLLLADDPEAKERVHLINISRDGLGSPDLKKYLESSGLTDKGTQKTGVVLIDTGFVGTVPIAIREIVPEKLQRRIQSHFLLSANPTVPSSRFALSAFDPASSEKTHDDLRPFINAIEHLPHFDGRSMGYTEEKDGSLTPIAKQDSDAKEKTLTAKVMADLKYFAESPGVKDLFNKTKTNLSLIAAAFRGEMPFDDPKVSAAIYEMNANGTIGGFLADIDDLSLKHRMDISPKTLSAFSRSFPGLEHYFDSAEREQKNAIEKANPDIAEYLKNPWEKIPELSLSKDAKTIQRLIQTGSEEMFAILCSELLSKKGAEKYPEILQQMLPYPNSHRWVIASVLNKPFWLESEQAIPLVQQLIHYGTSDRRVVDSVLSTREMAANPASLTLLDMILRRGKAKENLNKNLFSKPWWKQHPTLRRLSGNADPNRDILLRMMASGYTLQPAPAECKALAKLPK